MVKELSDQEITALLDPEGTVKALKAVIAQATERLTKVEIDYGLIVSDPNLSDEKDTDEEGVVIDKTERQIVLEQSGLGKARQQLGWRIVEMKRRLNELSPPASEAKSKPAE